jgi:hypothetical protein
MADRGVHAFVAGEARRASVIARRDAGDLAS